MEEGENLQKAVSIALTAGFHLDKEAFNLLNLISKTEDPKTLIEATLEKLKISNERSLLIGKDVLEETAKETFHDTEESSSLVFPKIVQSPHITPKSKKLYPRAMDIEADIKVLGDPGNNGSSTGSIDEYLEYFQDRFKKIRKLLRRRMDSRSAIPISDATRLKPSGRVKVFCIVTERRESNHGIFLSVEDLESKATALIPKNSPVKLLEEARSLLPDQVVCLGLSKTKRDFFIVEEIIFPDVPRKKPNRATTAVNVVLMSDLHIGSREFMREEFERFLLWLNGKYGDRKLKEIASGVKYVAIAGDIVDGVGIYPNQIRELSIQDIFEQYEVAAEFIEQIPDYIELIIIPGNHDASRKALPQPSISKRYVEPLFERRSLFCLGNPATISIHGVQLLMYHGRSLDDVLASAADIKFHSPERAMELLLRSRHLAPSYGQRTLIASAKRDCLVIEDVPDVFHAGHVHVMKHKTYRGTSMINSGAWQMQTSYQRKLGLEPTPGIIPVLDLKTLRVSTIDFNA